MYSFVTKMLHLLKTPQGTIKAAKSVNVKKRSEQFPLPGDYKLPNKFPPNVMAALEERRTLNIRERRGFLHEMGGSLYRNSSYLTSEEFERVASMILTEWSFLSDQWTIVSGVSFFVYYYSLHALQKQLKMTLMERLKYRRHTSGQHTYGTKGREKKSCGTKKTIRPVVPTVSTPFGQGEDESTHRNNIRYLKQLCSRSPLNVESIESLMKRTFTNRRYHITTGSVDTASSIVEVYPPLKMPYGVSVLLFITYLAASAMPLFLALGRTRQN